MAGYSVNRGDGLDGENGLAVLIGVGCRVDRLPAHIRIFSSSSSIVKPGEFEAAVCLCIAVMTVEACDDASAVPGAFGPRDHGGLE